MMNYKLCDVGIDSKIAKGYVLQGQDWNGWVIPVFDFENAKKITEEEGFGVVYDEGLDAFVEVFDENVHESKDDVEIWKGGFNKDIGVKTYAIGAGSWCWSVIE